MSILTNLLFIRRKKKFEFFRKIFLPFRLMLQIIYMTGLNFHETMSQKKVIKKIIERSINNIKYDLCLDFGCGDGIKSIHFPKKKYIGFDINYKFIKKAKNKYKKNTFIHFNDLFSKNYIEKLNQKKIIIFFYGVLHHISNEDFAKSIQKIVKYLNKKKIILILIEPIRPVTINMEMMMKSLDLGNYIRSKDEYLRLIRKQKAITKFFLTQVGNNKLIVITANLKN